MTALLFPPFSSYSLLAEASKAAHLQRCYPLAHANDDTDSNQITLAGGRFSLTGKNVVTTATSPDKFARATGLPSKLEFNPVAKAAVEAVTCKELLAAPQVPFPQIPDSYLRA
jgi:hypothetical protein